MIASTRVDKNLRSYYEERGLNLDSLDLSSHEDGDVSSMLKISHSSHIFGVNLSIPQGDENAVDIDVCEDVAIAGFFGDPGVECDQVVTVKGGSRRIRVAGIVRTTQTRRKAHVQIGNWMDQSYRASRDIALDLERVDGGPVYVAIGWAVPFTTKLQGSCKLLVWESVRLKAYWIAKYVVRLFTGIKQGEKGPSWL